MARSDHQEGIFGLSALATAAVTNNPAADKAGAGLLAKFDTDDRYFVLTGVGDDPLGIVDCNVDADARATIKTDGIKPVKLAGSVTAMDYAECAGAAVGTVVKATGLRPIAGRLLATGVAGNFVPLDLNDRTPRAPIVGADVASAATIVPTGEVFKVTGTETITAITTTGLMLGKPFTMVFTGAAVVANGSGIKLAGAADFTAAANSTLTLMKLADGVLYQVGASNTTP